MPNAPDRKRIIEEIPYLRRYARALTGSQDVGDDLALRTLEAILSGALPEPEPTAVKAGLFHAFHAIWKETNLSDIAPSDGENAAGLARITALPRHSREALLLHAIEKFSLADVAMLLDESIDHVADLIAQARRDLAHNLKGKVLIIEDEQLIARDLRTLVEGLGHRVTGVAQTYQDAVALAAHDLPDLVMADIQLTSAETGIDAVHALIDAHGPLPVVFVTAFPELLLTGERKEPAFLIAKPYGEDALRSAISQAMFFRSSSP